MTRDEQEKLLTENMNLIYYVINRYYPYMLGDEDFVQIGLIALWKAVLHYDGETSKFSTYAVNAVKNNYMNYFRKENFPKRKPKNAVVVSYEAMVPETFIDSQTDVIFGVDLKNLLTKREYEVISLLYYGYTQDEIAEQWGITQSGVSRLKRSAQKKIKDNIIDI